MTWQEYYDKFYDWADSTQIKKISSITDFSGADPEEVIDAALSFVDEAPTTRLLRKALDGGVRFSAGEVLELIYDVREDFRSYFAEHAGAVGNAAATAPSVLPTMATATAAGTMAATMCTAVNSAATAIPAKHEYPTGPRDFPVGLPFCGTLLSKPPRAWYDRVKGGGKL